MKNYFYPENAKNSKIYVSWNSYWLNQLMYINYLDEYMWCSLNQANDNLSYGITFSSLQKAIGYALSNGLEVYQLDTLDELADFIKEG